MVCEDTAAFLPTGCTTTSSSRILSSDSHGFGAWSRASHGFLKPNLAYSCSCSSRSPAVGCGCSSALKPNGVSSTCPTTSAGSRLLGRYVPTTTGPACIFRLLTTLCNSPEHPRPWPRRRFDRRLQLQVRRGLNRDYDAIPCGGTIDYLHSSLFFEAVPFQSRHVGMSNIHSIPHAVTSRTPLAASDPLFPISSSGVYLRQPIPYHLNSYRHETPISAFVGVRKVHITHLYSVLVSCFLIV